MIHGLMIFDTLTRETGVSDLQILSTEDSYIFVSEIKDKRITISRAKIRSMKRIEELISILKEDFNNIKRYDQ